MPVDAELVAGPIAPEAKRRPEERRYLLPGQVSLAPLRDLRQRDRLHLPIEILVPPASVERGRERHQFALGGRGLDQRRLALVHRRALVALGAAPGDII